jgi:hypothetical protein
MKNKSTISSAILGKTLEFYKYNDDVVDRLFFNNLDKPYVINDYNILTEENTLVDDKSFYKLNSLGYRSAEFDTNINTVFSGCSFTYGMGLKEESLWTEILGSKIGGSHVNLGLPGKSVSSIINNLYSYFREYGIPKNVFCLFPDFIRFELPINANIMISERNTSDGKYNSSPIYEGHLDAGGYVQDIILADADLENKPKYSKKPHKAEDVLSIDLTYWTAIKHILSFEQYCKAANINFVWATWDRDTNSAIDLIKDRYPDHYNNFAFLDEKYDKPCHSDQKENNLLLWDLAGDRDRGKDYAHPGVHFHIHVAECFYKAITIDET